MSHMQAAQVHSLWQFVPEPGAEVWKHRLPQSNDFGPLLELVEFLCGALWHLELACTIGSFSAEPLLNLRGRDELPWKVWLKQRESLGVECEGLKMVMPCSRSNSTEDEIRVLIQSMLLADAILRIAGAIDTLKTLLKQAKLSNCEASHMVEDILKQDGSFKTPPSEIQSRVLRIMAIRDSYMHSEVPSNRQITREKFRKLWFSNQINSFPPNSLATWADDCLKVWLTLVKVANDELQRLESSSGIP